MTDQEKEKRARKIAENVYEEQARNNGQYTDMHVETLYEEIMELCNTPSHST